MQTPQLGNYQLLKKLATGGMAEVWLARQTGIEGFERHIVVKRILPHLAEDDEFVQMFLNEARIASRFNHPNIAQIYDLGETNRQYYISMEFIHGEDLGRVMRKAWNTGQWVARPIAMRIVADACQGLYYAHSRTDTQGRPLNVVHRDISPQNILISFDGSVKLVDFGIAKAADQVSMTKSGAIKGKFAYMAPEQAAGKPLDARTDIFALGLVLYELLTGVRPLKRESELATLQAALECAIEPPSVVAEVPPDIDAVVMKALTKDPEERYRDARQFQMALEQHLVQQGTVATSVQVSELMEALFADRLADEARLGAPNPSTESSTSNPIPPEAYLPQPAPPPPPGRPPPQPDSPAVTMDEEPPDDDDESTLGADQPSVGGISLPAGTVMPSRRYNKGATSGATSFGRTQSRSEETRAEEVRPPPRRSTGLKRRASRVDEPAEDPPPRRRTTGGLKPRRTNSGSEMPEAPPRRNSSIDAPGAIFRSSSDAPVNTNSGLSKYVDVKGLKARQARRFRLMMTVLLLGGVGVGGFIFRDSLKQVFTSTGLQDGVPIRLYVTTTPPTDVLVIPPKSAVGRDLKKLGRTPLEGAPGAFVNDTIVLLNEDRGIRYEEVIDYGEPNQKRIIEKTFKEVTLLVRTRPPLRNAEVRRNGQKVGQVGFKIQLFEGVQQLEIHAPQLLAPVPFEVRLQPGVQVVQEVDVRSNLDTTR